MSKEKFDQTYFKAHLCQYFLVGSLFQNKMSSRSKLKLGKQNFTNAKPLNLYFTCEKTLIWHEKCAEK